MNLIITGGNAAFFSYLQLFVTSLRTQANYTDYVVVCDNTIPGEWNRPGKYKKTGSFTEEQLLFFTEHQVEVVLYHELLERKGVHRNKVDEILGKTTRYPHKFVYCSLIALQYMNKVKNICFFDADVFFQKDMNGLFGLFQKNNTLYMSSEMISIGDTRYMKQWVSYSDFNYCDNQESFLESMYKNANFCSGFFGADAVYFHRFTSLCWGLTGSSVVKFFSDQPLINILISYYLLPFESVAPEEVLHLGNIDKGQVLIQDKSVVWNGKLPTVVHFNGDKNIGNALLKSMGYDSNIGSLESAKNKQQRVYLFFKKVVYKIRKVMSRF